jgi:hypothetical protein
MAHLGSVARLPNVTIQILPNVAHARLLGGFAIAEHAAYVETAVAGQVFEESESLSASSPASIRSGTKHSESRSP